MQILWEAHYLILLIVLHKKFIKLNLNTDIPCAIKYKGCQICLEYTSVIDYLIEYKCLCCNKNYQKKLDENLEERFFNTCKFCKYDINHSILFLRKGVYPYENMDYLGKIQ